MKQLLVFLALAVLVVSLYGQISSSRSYKQLKDENDELHSQLAEIHSEAEDAQSELETLKSDVDDVQTKATDCDDCDEVQSAASDLDGPVQKFRIWSRVWKPLKQSHRTKVGLVGRQFHSCRSGHQGGEAMGLYAGAIVHPVEGVRKSRQPRQPVVTSPLHSLTGSPPGSQFLNESNGLISTVTVPLFGTRSLQA